MGQYSTTAARRVDWVTDSVKVSLHTAYTPDQDNHDFWNDVSATEITGTGYTTGGVALAGKSVAPGGTHEARLIASNSQWTSASFSTTHAIIYVDTAGASSTDPLLGYVDFGGTETVTTGTFTIQWDATGVLKIAAA